MDHGPNIVDPNENEQTAARNSRIGLILFFVYLLFYGGYVFLNAFAPHVMEIDTGVANIAILSGFGLIILAFVMAILYGWLCRENVSSGGVK
ncbi:MAG: DUF485 domain-containing protein [Pirellulaceae bacterium]|nr:DUF485 domain-containing protein [Pirellulaceae bacterium]